MYKTMEQGNVTVYPSKEGRIVSKAHGVTGPGWEHRWFIHSSRSKDGVFGHRCK